MSQEDIDKVFVAIQKKINQMQCPMCKELNFEVTPKYIQNILSDETNSQIGITNIDTIATVPILCKNCGFVSQHRSDYLLK